MFALLRSRSPARTPSAANNPVVYEQGRSSVTFREPASEYIMTHHIPPTTVEHGASIIEPPFHYHIYQSEFFHVRSGTGNFYCGLDTKPFAVLEAGGTAEVTAGRYHRFENASAAEPLIVDIHLSPESYEGEQCFFRNFFGYLDDCRNAKVTPSFFQLMVFLCKADTPLAIPLPWEFLGRVASRILLTSAATFGAWGLGYKSTYPEYYEEGKTK